MTAIEKLDEIYRNSLDGEINPEERKDLASLLEKIVGMADEFLTSLSADLSRDRKEKFRKLRGLTCDELTLLEKGGDVLCHYALIRECLEDIVSFVQRGCNEET